jgi:hypothetical protein
MRYPEVDRWRSVLKIESQLGEDMVAQVDSCARENESDVTRRFAGCGLFRERTELAGILWRQVRPEAHEVSTLENSHCPIVRTCARQCAHCARAVLLGRHVAIVGRVGADCNLTHARVDQGTDNVEPPGMLRLKGYVEIQVSRPLDLTVRRRGRVPAKETHDG